MNDLIKKFAEQAVEQSLFEPIKPAITVVEGDNKMIIPLVFVEKFAELIIRECATVADDNYDKGFCPVGGTILDRFDIKQ